MEESVNAGEPKIIKKNEDVAYLIDGWSVDDPNEPMVVKFGILQVDIMKRYDRGQNCALAQFDSIVSPGLITSRHIFRGLNRPLYADGSMHADKDKLVHTWKPGWDFDWNDRFGRPRKLPAPDNCVFVVLISRNIRHLDKWREVYGWIDRWNWVDEDPKLPEAPLNWDSRYSNKLFTRKGA
jgi:hypothetical protein